MANIINFNDVLNANYPGQDNAFSTLARRICKMINKDLALRQFEKFLPEDQLAIPMSQRLLSRDRSLLVEVSFSANNRRFIFTFQDYEYTQIYQNNAILDKICSDLTKYYSVHDERLLKKGKFTRIEFARAKNGITLVAEFGDNITDVAGIVECLSNRIGSIFTSTRESFPFAGDLHDPYFGQDNEIADEDDLPDSWLPEYPCDTERFAQFIRLCHDMHKKLHTRYPHVICKCDMSILPSYMEDGYGINTDIATYIILFEEGSISQLAMTYDIECETLEVLCFTDRFDKTTGAIKDIVEKYLDKLKFELTPFEKEFYFHPGIDEYESYNDTVTEIPDVIIYNIHIKILDKKVLKTCEHFLAEKIPQLIECARSAGEEIKALGYKKEESLDYRYNSLLRLCHKIHEAFADQDDGISKCNKKNPLYGGLDFCEYEADRMTDDLEKFIIRFDFDPQNDQKVIISIYLWADLQKVLQKNAMIILDQYLPQGEEYAIELEGKKFAIKYVRQSSFAALPASISRQIKKIASFMCDNARKARQALIDLYNSPEYKNKKTRIDEKNDSLTRYCGEVIGYLRESFPKFICANKKTICGRSIKDGPRHCFIEVFRNDPEMTTVPIMLISWKKNIFEFLIHICTFQEENYIIQNVVPECKGKFQIINDGEDDRLIQLFVKREMAYSEFANKPAQDLLDECADLIRSAFKIAKLPGGK